MSLVGCGPWGHEESDMTEQLHFPFSLSCIGKGSGNPLQCSCLETPRDGGAWWAAVCGVTQSQTRLKWLSSSMNPIREILSWIELQKTYDSFDMSLGVTPRFKSTVLAPQESFNISRIWPLRIMLLYVYVGECNDTLDTELCPELLGSSTKYKIASWSFWSVEEAYNMFQNQMHCFCSFMQSSFFLLL